MALSSGDQLTVIFDGTCGFCTAIRNRIAVRDLEQRISWVTCQQMTRVSGTPHLCERTVVSITQDGVVNTGAQAFGRILTTLTGSRMPVAFATLPVICTLLNLVYQAIARSRCHLSGTTPWCDQHPEDCRAGA